MLKVGEKAPPFDVETTKGERLSLASLAGKYVVLYFFPKAFTAGCTLETKGFQSHYAEVAELGAEVVGVSTDGMQTQCNFADKYGVEFPMIADSDRAVSKAYKATRMLIPFNKRVTYVIDPAGRIAAAFDYEVRAAKHVDEALAFIRRVAA